ncbi:hypothetical protein EMIHUDRAFT_446562 [Emiliania huxleyi CCMP1516]|uniref:Uncharacterized protein n=2 Tax=Emiliania huxleyi TaxID=2903 RepID=A0A0D3I3P3_EMIH1|nr:hypothetical protein EMIHUDRAFT_439152 [Emiliania huxleyi CCMP1516]XP_005758307.1 hypothetical protein EMIHUDRAFT_446562 [Emiliania huxleyi CCMP1516]EOD04507.1 hypothetical protein EMIHUDRAFT_439152 [Emiliania huxleyi CCMP1516]EOD05878.1 hypothetical protein EMIHUDRAFT_446562 [Emiliania huxleyi CCMP1516]|eukprot:XP_005756936.1 hypothetical protein EMIHUDRAFT_439152 [Emiliania huxleyi CCMP1516]
MAHAQVLVAAAAAARSVERDAAPSTALMMVSVCAPHLVPCPASREMPPFAARVRPLQADEGAGFSVAASSTALVAVGAAAAAPKAPDDASADDEAVRALLGTQFERGDAEDYVQLKDVAALLEAHHPDCHARLYLKTGTRVPSNEALAATVSRVLGRKVRNEQVTLPGQVKARGPIRGFRKVCGRP